MRQQTVEGPTQTAVAGASKEWKSRPGLARLTRVTVAVFPYLVGFAVAVLVARIWPPTRLGAHPILWWLAVAALSTASMIPADRVVRRLLPMSALLSAALAFPEKAPSRFRAAMRSTTLAQVRRRVEGAVAQSERGAHIDRNQYLLDLAALLTAHDRLTRGHSERVRAYACLIGEEMRLSKGDQQKLFWAGLLHDIGKMDVPAEILNKKSRPTKAEWEILQTHPAAASRYLAPLGGWLGPWAGAADEHHLRWDGKGYPKNTAGTDISLAGRIVAVADAYDVMTSTRSYKKGMAPADARIELARCAGGQFDPNVVRSFLNIGLGRARLAGGALASLPALATAFTSGVAATSGRVLLATTAISSGVVAAHPELPEPPIAVASVAADVPLTLSMTRPTPTPTATATPAPMSATVPPTAVPLATAERETDTGEASEPAASPAADPDPAAAPAPAAITAAATAVATPAPATSGAPPTPTPRSTVAPTPTPRSTVAPPATPTSPPSAAPTSPALVPAPTAPPSPTALPSPSSTPAPTATPTATAAPTPTPVPTATAVPTATPMPVIPTTPQQNVSGVMDALGALVGVGDAEADTRLGKAMDDLAAALGSSLWSGPSTLDGFGGDKVFKALADAVDELSKIRDPAVDVASHVALLTATAEELAIAAIASAESVRAQDLDDAYEELLEAADEEVAGDFDKAIEHYGHAWEDAQKADVPICHRDDGEFEDDDIPFRKLAEHRSHGDGRVGEPVTGQPGMVHGSDCRPVPA